MNNEIMNVNRQSFDIETLTNLIGTTAMNTNQLSKQMGILDAGLTDVRNDVSIMKTDIEELKYNVEITDAQANQIRRTAQLRVSEILHNSNLEKAKYYRRFIARCYSECKRDGGMGSHIATTKRGDYQRVINYLEAWIPKGGIDKLKKYVDECAEANRLAAESGY